MKQLRIASLAGGLALGILPQWPALPTFAQSPAASAFDGVWSVNLVCSDTADGARGYTFNFIAQVTAGVLHGEHGTAGTASWLTIDGRILPDGTSTLSAHGLTGSPEASVGRVRQLTPFRFTAAARFDTRHGSATRNETRPCTLQFLKV